MKFSGCNGELKDCAHLGISVSELAKVKPCGGDSKDCLSFVSFALMAVVPLPSYACVHFPLVY